MKRLILIALSLFLSSLLSAQLTNQIKLANTTFQPEANLDDYLSQKVRQTELVAGNYYRLIQFETLPDRQAIAKMESYGLTLLNYIPDKAYYASVSIDFNNQNLRNFGVRHISAIPDIMKVDEDLISGAHPYWAKSGDKIKLSMTYAKDLPEEYILGALVAAGIDAVEFNGYNNQMLIEVSPSNISSAINLPFLIRLEYGPEPYKPEDDEGKGLAKANLLDSRLPSGRQYNGQGINLMTRDDGHVGPHIDFQGRLNQTLSPNTLIHADNVSGVMCGAANFDPNIPGMATGADLHVINYQASFLDSTLRFHFDESVLVTNSSFSDGCNRGYTVRSQTVDDQCFENPTLMHVFSAGNSNGESCGYGAGDQWGNITGGHKIGKNVLAIGSTDNNGVISSFSSRGPAHDGRIKPDLTALGQSHETTLPNNTYRRSSGTSFSAPLVAGVMGMLHQAYADNNDGDTAEAALLKTIMLNTADDLGQPGPDFIYGWGNMNAYRSALAIEENRYQKVAINAGETLRHMIEVPPGVAQIKVMVYWADPSATPNVRRALINDLDCTLTATDGTEYLPYILDSSPDPDLLNTPATTGIDRLNNMEQVFIANPEPGQYELAVQGTTLPFGAHEYFYTWEYVFDEIFITFPTGEDLFVPGQGITVHWEAIDKGETFSLEISLDDGATWFPLQGASLRKNKDISIPGGTLTDRARVKVIRNNEESISEPFTIAPRPRNLNIERVCFDNLDLTWPIVEGAISYDVYRLGDRYMDFEMTVTDTFATLPISNTFEQEYFAVSANYDNNIRSQRSIAIGTEGAGLVNCKLDRDLTFESVQLINSGNYIVCERPLTEFPTVVIENSGLETLTNFDLSYSINGSTVVSENVSINLEPDSTYTHTFSEPFVLTENGNVELITWVSRDGELLTQNDTINTVSIAYFDEGEALPLRENFNALDRLPRFWNTESPEDNATWGVVTALQIDGDRDNVLALPFADAGERGSTDILSTVPLDFNSAGDGTLVLSFDRAYFHGNRNDGLVIRLMSDCGNQLIDTLYDRRGEDLSSSSSFFDLPEDITNWSSESIDLSAYRNMDKVIIQFIGLNDEGNNLYLDNINVSSVMLSTPVVDFDLFGDGVCILEELVVRDNSSGGLLSYNWDFGSGALPRNLDGTGPHSFSYFIPGNKTIALTVSNPLGSVTEIRELTIEDVPSGGWDFEEIGNATVEFDASFSNVMDYLWDFGDGNTSVLMDPVHQFPGPGTYEVSLLATNNCGQRKLISQVVIMTSSVENINEGTWRLAPNPIRNRITLYTSQPIEEAHIQLINLSSETVWEKTMRVDNQVDLSLGEIPSGFYTVLITSDNKRQSLKLVKI